MGGTSGVFFFLGYTTADQQVVCIQQLHLTFPIYMFCQSTLASSPICLSRPVATKFFQRQRRLIRPTYRPLAIPPQDGR